MHYHLVPTTPADAPWLERLRRAVYRELFEATWGGWDEDRHRRHFAACLERGGIFAIEIDGARVGMVQRFEHRDTIEIGELQVEPEYQGRGIGTQVLRDTMTAADARKRKVILRTGIRNQRAIALYHRLGFQSVARTETHEQMEWTPPP
jgi:ribosomal protein S18 acetylase RimI-like enzyme